jgi:hypothetical protein
MEPFPPPDVSQVAVAQVYEVARCVGCGKAHRVIVALGIRWVHCPSGKAFIVGSDEVQR